MKASIAVPIVIGVVGIGWLVCPRVPDVDPDLLLSRVMFKCHLCPTCSALLRRNYTPLVEGEDAIAGRPAWVLRLKPHSKHMPWRQLWIDKKTYVALAQRDWSSRNEVKWPITTTDITYGRPEMPASAGPRQAR